MAKGEIRVDLVADASSLERAMRKADAAAGKFEKSTRDMGDSLEKSQRQARGTADLFDGFATTLGFNADAPIRFSRGVADLADGLSTVFVPAVKSAIERLQAWNATLSASQKFAIGAAAGVAIAGGAFLSLAATTDKGQDAIGSFTDLLNKRVNQEVEVLGKGLGWLDDHIGGIGSKFLKFTGIMGGVSDAAKASADRLAGFAAAAVAAAKAIDIANRLGGSVEDPDGAFASQAWIDQNSGQAAIVAAMDAAERASSSAAKKAVKSTADKALEAFKLVQPKLEAAAKKFADAVTLRSALADNFKLGFGDDLGHNVTESLHRQVDQFKAFVKKIASLRKMGLNEGLVRDFADAGPAALDEMNRIDSGNIGIINDLAKQAGKARDQFSNSETMRRTGVDPTKDIKVTLDIKGGDTDLKNLIKKWVRTDGGGNVQVAFR